MQGIGTLPGMFHARCSKLSLLAHIIAELLVPCMFPAFSLHVDVSGCSLLVFTDPCMLLAFLACTLNVPCMQIFNDKL